MQRARDCFILGCRIVTIQVSHGILGLAWSKKSHVYPFLTNFAWRCVCGAEGNSIAFDG